MSTPDQLVHSFPAGITTAGPMATTQNVGTAASGVTATEFGTGRIHNTLLAFTAKALTPTIPADAEGVGALLYTFPAGVILIHACRLKCTAGSFGSATNAADVGLGTVIATLDVSVLSGTATFEDLITGQTVADVSSFVLDKTTIPTAGAPKVIEAAGAHTVHLNAAATWNAASTGTVTGSVELVWSFLGA